MWSHLFIAVRRAVGHVVEAPAEGVGQELNGLIVALRQHERRHGRNPSHSRLERPRFRRIFKRLGRNAENVGVWVRDKTNK